MRISSPRTTPTTAGLLLLDSDMNPIFLNRAAVLILSYPDDSLKLQDKDRFLAHRIRSALAAQGRSSALGFPHEFRSGRRLYYCRSFQMDSTSKGTGGPTVAVLLERGLASSISLQQVSERFHLTVREQEVLALLLEGLTSKEIATRMKISPNTVKAFLRLIMVKMSVSTRSGVICKALTARL